MAMVEEDNNEEKDGVAMEIDPPPLHPPPPPPPPPHTAAQAAHKAAFRQALALRAAAVGIFNAHLAGATATPGAGFSDILLASEGSIRFLALARSMVRADHMEYKSTRNTSGVDASTVYFTTLHRMLHKYERRQRAGKKGRQRTYHGTVAMEFVEHNDIIMCPMIPVRQWARRSAHTAHVIAMGDFLPQLAAKALQYGRRLVSTSEDFTTQQCPHCGYCEPRGSALFVLCSQCGLASHRDAGMAPNGIFKRALVHGAQARLGVLAALASAPAL
jgi:hypothetical protein